MVRQGVATGIAQAFDEHVRFQLPVLVKQFNADPWKIG